MWAVIVVVVVWRNYGWAAEAPVQIVDPTQPGIFFIDQKVLQARVVGLIVFEIGHWRRMLETGGDRATSIRMRLAPRVDFLLGRPGRIVAHPLLGIWWERTGREESAADPEPSQLLRTTAREEAGGKHTSCHCPCRVSWSSLSVFAGSHV